MDEGLNATFKILIVAVSYIDARNKTIDEKPLSFCELLTNKGGIQNSRI